MTDFIAFARASGLDLLNCQPSRDIQRCPTLEHPNKNNASFMYDGKRGWCLCWDNGAEIQYWDNGKEFTPAEKQEWIKQQTKHNEGKAELAADTARKAQWMLSKANLSTHDYFACKGFPDHIVKVMERDGNRLALLPMRVGSQITSLQIISREGDKWRKTFLRGGTTKGATFTIGQGEPVLCEGFCTGLSIHRALSAAKIPASVVICYSAQNMVYVSKTLKPRLVIADHDEAGLKAAEATGALFYTPPVDGFDFNDLETSRGAFFAMMEMKRLWLTKAVITV